MRDTSYVNRTNTHQITLQTVTFRGDWRGATRHIYWTQPAARTTLTHPLVLLCQAAEERTTLASYARSFKSWRRPLVRIPSHSDTGVWA